MLESNAYIQQKLEGDCNAESIQDPQILPKEGGYNLIVLCHGSSDNLGMFATLADIDKKNPFNTRDKFLSMLPADKTIGVYFTTCFGAMEDVCVVPKNVNAVAFGPGFKLINAFGILGWIYMHGLSFTS
mmetsp:Transcript_18758/g.29418  ORF Transcript_18758/g.29418 Transcript_18758/m.29418 type:complete len:129 (-) Transcript_18758:109-495(-)